MAYDYAFVHLEFTIPLAAVLTLINYPFLSRRHWYQTAVLVLIAVVATIPWDSYLIRHHVWTYPPDAIMGPTLWSIPAEELFFFVVQTYTTSMIYHLANKPLVHAEYLCAPASTSWFASTLQKLVQVVIMDLALLGFWLTSAGGKGTYLGLILIWACPFALLTWSLGGVFMIALPWTSTVLPILLPTLYLWAVDEGALRRGTWSIGSGTKLGTTLYGSLDLEEAVFFLATNVLIVFGLGAFDHALAVIDAFPDAFPHAPECPPPVMLVRALYMPWTAARQDRVDGIREAVVRLCRKSRSFYLASSTFSGRLRIDLVLLYSYCRMADDLVDEPPEGLSTATWIDRLTHHLDLVYKKPSTSTNQNEEGNTTTPTTTTPKEQKEAIRTYVDTQFPASAQSALTLLPTSLLPPDPLYGLLEGFKTDSEFSASSSCNSSSPPSSSSQDKAASVPRSFPIATGADLDKYASQVAGTVGQLCLALIAHHHVHTSAPTSPNKKKQKQQGMTAAQLEKVTAAANEMGIALQYVNIARDIAVDAAIGRVYLPTTWLQEVGLTPDVVIEALTRSSTTTSGSSGGREDSEDKKTREDTLSKLIALRARLLARATEMYTHARPTMALLPREARRPMVVAVESYMEIARVLREKDEAGQGIDIFRTAAEVGGKPRRATVPKGRRLRVALTALLSD